MFELLPVGIMATTSDAVIKQKAQEFTSDYDAQVLIEFLMKDLRSYVKETATLLQEQDVCMFHMKNQRDQLLTLTTEVRAVYITNGILERQLEQAREKLAQLSDCSCGMGCRPGSCMGSSDSE